jgi:hypothetical protein
MEKKLLTGLTYCESSIEALTSEEMAGIIANSEPLLDKMLVH